MHLKSKTQRYNDQLPQEIFFNLNKKQKNPAKSTIKYFESATPELGQPGDGKRTIF